MRRGEIPSHLVVNVSFTPRCDNTWKWWRKWCQCPYSTFIFPASVCNLFYLLMNNNILNFLISYWLNIIVRECRTLLICLIYNNYRYYVWLFYISNWVVVFFLSVNVIILTPTIVVEKFNFDSVHYSVVISFEHCAACRCNKIVSTLYVFIISHTFQFHYWLKGVCHSVFLFKISMQR